MENDDSAVSFDTITCESGQFGFFQKRLFLINTLIQTACVSVLLYTCACMPEVDETEGDDNTKTSGQAFVISHNGYHYDKNDSSYIDTNRTANSDSVPLTSQNSTTSLVVALDVVYRNISTIASSFVNDMSLNNVLDNSTSAGGDTFKCIIDKLKQTLSTTTAGLEYALDNIVSFAPTSSEHLTSNTSPQLVTSSTVTSFPDLKQSANLNAGNNITIFEENIKRGDDVSNHVTNISLRRSPTDGSTIRASNDLSNERYVNPTQHNGTLDPRHYLAQSTTVVPYFDAPNSLTSQEDSTQAPARAFILFRKDLRRTQILEDLSFKDLVRLTSYAQSGGMILGALAGSMMADNFGRRKLLYVSLTGMLVLHCCLALSVSWVMFMILRTVAVGCAGAAIVTSFVTVIEFLGPDWRDACTCSCLWTLGAILLSLETVVTLHWRWLAVLSGGICLPLIVTYFTSMESLRWLQCQHRFAEAEYGFREVVAVNSATVPDIMVLLDQSRGCIVNNMHVKRFTYMDLFQSLDSTKWTFTLVYTCTISATVYFCLLWRVKEITSFSHINGFLPFVLDLPLTWSVIIMNRCLGRRWCLFLYAVASGFALVSVVILHVTGNVDVLPSLVTGLALFGKIGVTASMSLIVILATEMYPTVTRCMGVAVAMASASAGSMLFNALAFLEQYHYTVPFVAYGAMMSSVGVVGLMFPETIRKPLKNVQQCRHRKIPLMEGARLVGRPPSLWEAV